MVLDRAVTDEASARVLLGELLGARIDRVTLRKVDLVSETTLCDVRFTLRAVADRTAGPEGGVPEGDHAHRSYDAPVLVASRSLR